MTRNNGFILWIDNHAKNRLLNGGVSSISISLFDSPRIDVERFNLKILSGSFNLPFIANSQTISTSSQALKVTGYFSDHDQNFNLISCAGTWNLILELIPSGIDV